jgi:hypothetical protein
MNIILKNKDISSVFAITASILMIPLVAMQFTQEVDWKLLDFVLMGILISGTGLLIVIASRKIKNINHRALAIVALIATLLIVWVHLAVGIVDTWPLAGS